MIVLIISPGKAGSSSVARILHTQFNVNMGNHFRSPDEENPNGYYEDLEFKNINEKVLRGILTFDEFETRLNNIVKNKREDWGLKDPRLCHLWGSYLKYLPDAKIIITIRNTETIINSCMKYYGWNLQNAKRIIKKRLIEIIFLYKLHPLIINFNKKLSDEEIYKLLEEGMYA